MKHILRGQWTGGNNLDSFAIVNINLTNDILNGRISVLENNKINETQYSLWIWSTFTAKLESSNVFVGEVFIKSVHNRTGVELTPKEFDEFKEKTNLEYPKKVTISGYINSDNNLTISTEYLYPTHARKEELFELSKTAKKSSAAPNQHMTWEQFKSFALNQEDELIYRGQAKSWPLQTSYHRTGYADLVSYLDNEVIELEHHINAISNHPYNIQEDRSLGALLNLAQHHGYPTPLLDWTKSPYVAAFFAFENKSELKKDGKVTIFIFDEKKWSAQAGKDAPIRAPHIIVRTFELPGFNNPRVLPQQALTMFSNMNDVEQIIQANEKTKGDFLKRVTIDVSEADRAMRDLKLMGLTWGSLFPGFDGICKQLKSRHFI
jgi:hypothetical protein